ncbi:hypothetical protein ACFSM5_07595 [Lacibacterium aquatile]|uniref:Uncharacterized protein n=1 Tax=Lacibacterium aquatile TaxID=1168082 RepID=A0ABW5DNQ1_9PROT
MPITPETIRSLADQDIPFPVKNLALGDDGLITHEAASTLGFHFTLHGRRWDADVAVQADKGGIVTVSHLAGPMPYSIDGVDRRQAVQQILQACPARGGLAIRITRKMELCVEVSAPLSGPLDDSGVLSGAIALALKGEDWLPVIEHFTRKR